MLKAAHLQEKQTERGPAREVLLQLQPERATRRASDSDMSALLTLVRRFVVFSLREKREVNPLFLDLSALFHR